MEIWQLESDYKNDSGNVLRRPYKISRKNIICFLYATTQPLTDETIEIDQKTTCYFSGKFMAFVLSVWWFSVDAKHCLQWDNCEPKSTLGRFYLNEWECVDGEDNESVSCSVVSEMLS